MYKRQVAQYLNYKIESKVSLTYNSTYEFVWCSIIMLVLGLIAGINIIWILHSENTIETIIAIAFQVIAAVVGFEALKIITFVPLMIIGVYTVSYTHLDVYKRQLLLTVVKKQTLLTNTM